MMKSRPLTETAGFEVQATPVKVGLGRAGRFR
jgi:hypothetical protein